MGHQRLGIEEYFLYDPRNEYLDPPLQGYRLSGGRYQPISPEPDGSLVSQVLDMVLSWDESGLQLIDARTGDPDEAAQQYRRLIVHWHRAGMWSTQW